MDMSRKEDTENEGGDTDAGRKGGDRDTPYESEPTSETDQLPSDTRRLEEIEDELRAKEQELTEVRDEIEPKLQEKEKEIAGLRDELQDSIEDHERRIDELREELRNEIRERRSSPGGTPSERPAKAAGAILGVTGLFGLIAAIATAVVALSPGFTSPFIDPVGADVVLAAAGLSALLSLVVLSGGWTSYKRMRWYFSVFVAVVATVFVTPLGLPALILLVFAEPGFDLD